MSDELLVKRAQKGDLLAFEQLVREHEGRVFTVALRSCGNREDAADIAQEVFLRLYRSLSSFRGDSGISTWLYRVTSNICIDHARKNSGSHRLLSFTQVFDDDEKVMEVPDTRYSPEKELEKSQLREAINGALLELSPEHRQIIILREVEGLSYDDIGAALEIEQGTVKSRVARARAHLRQLLSSDGNIFARPPSNKRNEKKEGGDHNA